MTIVKVKKQNSSIIQVECSGHSGYASEGEDIVCSAISSIVQTAGMGLRMYLKLNVIEDIDEKKGFYKISIPENLNSKDRHDADVILETMFLGLKDIESGYSKNLKVEVIKL